MHSCLLKVPIFQHLSSEELDHVHEFIHPLSYSKGEFVQLAGDNKPQLLVLNRGSVKVSRTTPDGNEQLIRNLSPGDYIGDAAVFAGVAADYDVVALSDASFCVLSGQDLHQLILTYPDLAIKIISEQSIRLKSAEAKIESLALKSVDERLLEALVDYADGRSTFDLQLSKKDLAIQLGMRPETLSRSLKQLQEKGTIKLDGKTITIVSGQL